MIVESILQAKDKKEADKIQRVKNGTKAKSVKRLTKKEMQIIELAQNTVLPTHYKVVWTEEDFNEMMDFLSSQEVIAVDTETTGVNPFIDRIVGISFYAPHRGFYIPLMHKDSVEVIPTDNQKSYVVGADYVKVIPKEYAIKRLKPLIEEYNKKFLLHNAKFDMHVLYNNLGITIKPYFDTMVAQALLDENQSKALKDIAPYYLKIEADKFSTLFGSVTFDKVPILLNPNTRTGCLAGYYAIKDTELTYKVAEFQLKNLNKPHLANIKKLLFEVEMPFLEIVYNAEQKGVKLDEEYLERSVASTLFKELEELRQKIWAYTGEINLNSPQQLSEALYVKLKLPRVNTESPNSTDRVTLNKIKKEHPVIPLIIDYKAKFKLATAFVVKLPQTIINGRVHTSFNTIGTKTGRMSSSSPNLQQIPAKVGGLIRNAFIADEKRLLVSIDFSQQELRVLAHVSKDPVLLDIYLNDRDVHSMTAVGMWNRKHSKQQLTYDQFEAIRGLIGVITDADGNFDSKRVNEERIKPLKKAGYSDISESFLREMVEFGKQLEKTRKNAKVVNFGIIYGMQANRLADTLEIPIEEAEIYIASYFDNYPGVKRWMVEQRKKMDKVMYTETLLGRKRRVYPEMQSGNRWIIEKAYRMGINSVIQGSSADMVKLASIKLQPLLKELDSQIVLWVHDELIFDVPENIGIENLKGLADIMANALPLDCGLKSDIEVGRKWGQKLSEEDIKDLFEEGDD